MKQKKLSEAQEWFLRGCVKDGYLDPDKADKMTPEQVDKLMDWADYQASLREEE